MAALVYWLIRRKREGKPTLLDPGLFSFKPYSVGVTQIFLQQFALGGMLIALPIYLQLVLEVLSINDDARDLGLQVALLVALIAALIGIVNSFRMMRLPDPEPSTAAEGIALG